VCVIIIHPSNPFLYQIRIICDAVTIYHNFITLLACCNYHTIYHHTRDHSTKQLTVTVDDGTSMDSDGVDTGSGKSRGGGAREITNAATITATADANDTPPTGVGVAPAKHEENITLLLENDEHDGNNRNETTKRQHQQQQQQQRSEHDAPDDDDEYEEREEEREEEDGEGEPASKKPRKYIHGDKADLYSHFETLEEKAYTKGGKDLGLYLCVCKYCQAAYQQALKNWQSTASTTASTDVGGEATKMTEPPMAPQPFPRTRRYCVNHQKQCPHIPPETAAAVMTAVTANAPRVRTRASGTFLSHNQENGSNDSASMQALASLQSTFRGSGPVTNTTTVIQPATFEVYVSKDTFKFNAAHFVAFRGYRERLHGHNYTVSVRLQGSQTSIGADGYVIDYGNIKTVCKTVCKELNEYFLCPAFSDVLQITHPSPSVVRIECRQDGTYFEFPAADCKFLPIVHATTEELAIYLWSIVMERLNASYLLQRGIASMELTVAEAPGQQATFRYPVSTTKLDVRKFIQGGDVVPQPCLDKSTATTTSTTASSSSSCNPDCVGCSPSALHSLTVAMKANGLLVRDVTPEELRALVHNNDKEQ